MTTPNAIDLAGSVSATKAVELKQQGVLAVGRYLGPASSWKAIQLTEAQNILNAGLKIISVFETSPNHSSYFTTLEAQQDAKNAAIYAQAIKQPTGTVIFFTVDYNAPNADLPTIAAYFNALIASSKDYEVGAYGDYQVIEYLKGNTSVKHFMQTIAWSGGKVDDSADVFQYDNDTTLVGLSVDLDQLRAENVAWGLPTPTATTQPAPKADPTPAPTTKTETVWVNYTIKSGDTVSEIAAAHNTTVAEIESKNGINSTTDLIYVGQIIKVPEQKTVVVEKSKPVAPSIAWVNYTVKSGDTVSQIAVDHNTSVGAIESKNGINPSTDAIYAGQVIKVPSNEKFVTVKSGDNLSKIAADNGLSLAQVEGLNPSIKGPDFVIQPGDRVRVK